MRIIKDITARKHAQQPIYRSYLCYIRVTCMRFEYLEIQYIEISLLYIVEFII